jgi:hypothetical protein
MTAPKVTASNIPAWISSGIAIVTVLAAGTSWMANPTIARVDDHENRIRVVESVIQVQMTEVKAELRNLRHELERKSNTGVAR